VAESESPVSGGSGTLIRLRHDSNTFGLNLAHDGQRLIGRTVVHHNDFFSCPSLRQGGTECVDDQFPGIVGGYENGDQGQWTPFRGGGRNRSSRD
jgi:hypothetical protein